MIKLQNIKLENILKYIKGIISGMLIIFIAVIFSILKNFIQEGKIKDELIITYLLFLIGIIIILSIILTFGLIIIKKTFNKDLPCLIESFKNIGNFNYNKSSLSKFEPWCLEGEEVKRFVEDVYDEQLFLQEIKEIAAAEYVLDDVLDKIFEKLNKYIRVDRIGVAFVDYDRRTIVAETAKISYGDFLLGPGYEVKMEDTSLTEMLKTKKPKYYNDLSKEFNKGKRKNNSIELVLKEGIKSNMILPLIVEDNVFGFMFVSSFENGSYNKQSLRIGENVAYSIASIIDQTFLTKKMLSSITLVFAEMVESKDLETGDHIKRMTSYSKTIAQQLVNHEKKSYRVNTSFIKDIELYAPLHDIGKIGIPDNILGKPGKLTKEEWGIMKQHTNIGADILTNFNNDLEFFKKQFYQMAIDIARHHHERWDGTGYPLGLKGEDIPLSARIVAIADVFDALSSKRPYKERIPFDTCIDMIKESSGTHFDPELVNAFLQNITKIKRIYKREYEVWIKTQK